MRSALRHTSCLVAVTLMSSSPAAHAYRTAGDVEMFAGQDRVAWPDPEIHYHISTHDLSEYEAVLLEEAVYEALGAWQFLTCGGPTFIRDARTASAGAPDDGSNTIEWVRSGWLERGFREDAAAYTDVAYSRAADGRWNIAEADLYINAERYQWGLGVTPSDGMRDPASMLIHEAGHMLGLMHPCEEGGIDGAPDCAENPILRETTMYPLYDEGQVTLHEDDVAGACFLYPSAMPDTVQAGDSPILAGPGESCSSNSDCIPRTRCVEHHCTLGSSLPGDPCAAHADCASRYCNQRGYCVRGCFGDVDCNESQSCEAFDDFGAICRGPDPLFGLGEPCDDAADCLGDQCVEREESRRTACSRSCADTECPEGWDCSSVESRKVCIPTAHLVTGGCRIGSTRDAPSTGAGAIAWIFGLAVGASRCLRRRKPTIH